MCPNVHMRITLDGASSVAGAAGNALKNSVHDLQRRGHQMGEDFKADVKAAPGRAAEHLKAEVQAVPGKAARAVKTAAREKLDAVKADVAAMPDKARKKIERKVEAKKEMIQKRIRTATMEKIDSIIPGPVSGRK